MPLPAPRTTFALAALFCAGLLANGYYLQYAQGLEPCPLCITQRLLLALAGLIALAAALHGRARRGYGALLALAAAGGGAVSARHVYIQHLPPDQVPSCGPGLDYMFNNFPLAEALSLLLKGDGNCAETSWRLLGLSIPEWTLLCFAALLVAGIWQLMRPEPRPANAL